MGLHVQPSEESNTVGVSINLSYSHWLVSTAVLLVDGSVVQVQQPQHSQLPKLCSVVSRGPPMLGLQTWPGSMFYEDSDRLSVSCRTKQLNVVSVKWPIHDICSSSS